MTGLCGDQPDIPISEQSLLRCAPVENGWVRFARLTCVPKCPDTVHQMATGTDKRKAGWDRLPILAYHHVGPKLAGTFANLTLPPFQFREQMAWLAEHGWTAISLSQAFARRNLPRKPVVLTFDDAYRDLCAHALPVLSQHGFAATIFVPSGHIGGTNAWDAAATRTPHRIMTAEEIREAARSGVEIGSHGRMHLDLTQAGDAELDDELQGSKTDLERLIGSAITSFAYPYGRVNDAVAKRVRDLFQRAATIDPGLNRRTTDVFRLRRSMVRPVDSIRDFAMRVRLGRVPMEDLRRTVARARGRLADA